VQPQSIGINPKLGINSLPELIAQAKKLPGSISYAVTGVGRLTHLTGELLQIRGNFKLQMVPCGGSAHARRRHGWPCLAGHRRLRGLGWRL
jgi:tripartite-type tricarboxylate transporter receptor subunit TctC